MQMRGAGPFSAPAWGLLPAVMALAVTGCTMCPDPHDYSGPVPNGSPPQNDFRARSNGILPIGASPHPWPTIVKKSSGGHGGPVGAGRLAKGEVKQLSAEKPVAASDADPPDEAGEDAGEKPVIVSSTATRNTVAVIGEADDDDGERTEEAAHAAPEESATAIAPVIPEPEASVEDGSGVEPVAEETSAASEPAPVPPLPEDDETLPESESVAEAAPPQPEPEAPADAESEAEPAAAGPQSAPEPRPEMRETPGWRPRRSLNPALYGR